jgi:hypothetical protein
MRGGCLRSWSLSQHRQQRSTSPRDVRLYRAERQGEQSGGVAVSDTGGEAQRKSGS